MIFHERHTRNMSKILKVIMQDMCFQIFRCVATHIHVSCSLFVCACLILYILLEYRSKTKHTKKPHQMCTDWNGIIEASDQNEISTFSKAVTQRRKK